LPPLLNSNKREQCVNVIMIDVSAFRLPQMEGTNSDDDWIHTDITEDFVYMFMTSFRESIR